MSAFWGWKVTWDWTATFGKDSGVKEQHLGAKWQCFGVKCQDSGVKRLRFGVKRQLLGLGINVLGLIGKILGLIGKLTALLGVRPGEEEAACLILFIYLGHQLLQFGLNLAPNPPFLIFFFFFLLLGITAPFWAHDLAPFFPFPPPFFPLFWSWNNFKKKKHF